MYKLRRIAPFKGFYREYTYKETVEVHDGVCDVNLAETRDTLLRRGYEMVPEAPPPAAPKAPQKKWKSKKRGDTV